MKKQSTQSTIVIDGESAVLGRLASYAAKQALQGIYIIIVNTEKVIITGNKQFLLREYGKRKEWIGSNQKGPRHTFSPEKIMKRTIRGMLPEHRWGRGREALKRIRCYDGVPVEYAQSEKVKIEKPITTHFITLNKLTQQL